MENLDELLSPQKPIQLGFQGAPAAPDFDGLDASFGDVFEEGGSRNLEVSTGLFGGINDLLAVFIQSVGVDPVAAVKTAASVGLFSPICAASALHYVIIYHKYPTGQLEIWKNPPGFPFGTSIGKSFVFL